MTTKQRYSNKIIAKRPRANAQRFIAKAELHFNHRFNYSEDDYTTQKSPITIVCPDHGAFQQTPDKHLQSRHGCPRCGVEARATRRTTDGEADFMAFFEAERSGYLALASAYRGVKAPITVRCREAGHQIDTTPDALRQRYRNGCPKCMQINATAANRMAPEEFRARVEQRFPDLDFASSQYVGMVSPISFSCSIHGVQTRRAADLLHGGQYGCAACGKLNIGTAAERLRQLEEGNEGIKSQPTRLGIMTVNVFDITAIKVGITRRRLEERYREPLVSVHFETVLEERDALLLERYLHKRFHSDRDLQIFSTGKTLGERWPGDQEIYRLDALDKLLSAARAVIVELESADTDYWDCYPELQQPLPWERKVPKRLTGIWNTAKAVICLDDHQRYDSATAAALAYGTSQGNVSSVCRGERGGASGKRFAFEDDLDSGTVPIYKPYAGTKKAVVCLDTCTEYASITEAANEVGISGSHITSVCRGLRGKAGGYRWAYVAEVEAKDLPNFESQEGGPIPVIHRPSGTRYRSISDAAAAHGLSSATIINHCKHRVREPQFSYV